MPDSMDLSHLHLEQLLEDGLQSMRLLQKLFWENRLTLSQEEQRSITAVISVAEPFRQAEFKSITEYQSLIRKWASKDGTPS